ncbi:hypothetical protein SK128_017651 [Halocaridina rubra]|uniref:Uncharacterized protein n=1 Tax=Halocaridina rubra TaxID=373956 RepID=A0AAN8X2Q6_HALRR
MEEYPAATTAEGEMQIEAASQIEEVASPLQKLRCLVLARGYDGLLQFGKIDYKADTRKSGHLSYLAFGFLEDV